MTTPPSLPPSLPGPEPGRKSSSAKIIAGLLIGIAPMLVTLLILALVQRGSQVESVIMGMFVAAGLLSLVGGTLVGIGATQKVGARVVISILVAVGLFAMDVFGGIFFGCFIVMGKGL